MPRPRPPPTPTGSSDLRALENLKAFQASDMESIFTLPPPAIRSSDAQSQNHQSGKSSHARDATNTTALTQSTPPISPQDKPLTASPRHKRTSSGVVKSTAESTSTNGGASNSYALPPPPSRARKIIQMKPKSQATNNSSPASDASYVPPTSAATSTTSAPSNKASATSSGGASSNATATNTKRKQPSATSAAGRKIARKTAHSIIERRRRSKMNEEFGVLKDMIPACEGVEMHKLAILQAGIEYVRYLEGCVAQLKEENAKLGGKVRTSTGSRMQTDDPPGEDEDMDEEEDEQDEDEEQDEAVDDVPAPTGPPARIRNHRPSGAVAGSEWALRDSRKSSVASLSGSSAYPSPHIHSQSQGAMDEAGGLRKRPLLPAGVQSFTASPSISVHSGGGIISSATPTPTLLSPAFNSIHFSPDLARTQTNSSVGKSGSSGVLNTPASSWATVNPSGSSSGSVSNPSPNMQPLPSPKAAMNLPLPHPAVASLQLPPHYSAAIQREREGGSKSPGGMSDASGTAEATASAALMMLTNEWRGGGRSDAVQGNVPAPAVAGMRDDSKDRGKGMSVRDLLSS
ncbi:uncharacterized protein Z520_09800 [Fonsecaea multimorphosa CBS 102226]|uniref:BHLH domain-containing protein n=1 Tax=Fonsecaea multimorphosa CBS 102226 TaxID=1442371 RepID=A0A0D2JV84_9EURO|nr:uncharacterized protein Z520_09800 [Fonsecaea multimorphosa CBS 102226]KIX94414.1 hypothetical protein Z520_09800 [Fonsecaea multimorphosa CBS 102226]OAL20173.1 hypothetical protein AYO22_09145 [Fonsecaea multimorphosa]